jgi:hypothetical protein
MPGSKSNSTQRITNQKSKITNQNQKSKTRLRPGTADGGGIQIKRPGR